MVQVDALRKKVYLEIQEIADQSGELCSKIEEDIPQYIPEATVRLRNEMKCIYEKYKILQETNLVGNLEWIYISFLRTGLLDHSPCYRIDFYDSRGCICEIDCSGIWDIPEIFNSYYRTLEQIMVRMQRQTYLGLHEIHGILYNLAESFRTLADRLIFQLVQSMNSEWAEMALPDSRLKIMLGDYLDHGELIAEIIL